jgi:hypothetical protein
MKKNHENNIPVPGHAFMAAGFTYSDKKFFVFSSGFMPVLCMITYQSRPENNSLFLYVVSRVISIDRVRELRYISDNQNKVV